MAMTLNNIIMAVTVNRVIRTIRVSGMNTVSKHGKQGLAGEQG